jgi:hypothetical protein
MKHLFRFEDLRLIKETEIPNQNEIDDLISGFEELGVNQKPPPYPEVDTWDRFNSEYEKNSMVDSIEKQIEKATVEKVIRVTGRAGANDFELEFYLKDGSRLETEYFYSPYVDVDRGRGILHVCFTPLNGKKVHLRDCDISDEKTLQTMDKYGDVYGMVKKILEEKI